MSRRYRTPRIVLLILSIAGFFPLCFSQNQYILSGHVADSTTGEPLVAATIRIAGTARGTVSNDAGEYRLPVNSGPNTIIFSLIGYLPDTLHINIISDTTTNMHLVSSPVLLPEVVAIAEDPAVEIIRKAIANKHLWMDKLHSYKFEAFTRQVLHRDTSIAGITEAYTTGYMLTGDTLREVVTQKRQTQNIPLESNFAAVGRIVNFNEDEVTLIRLSINGNTSGYTFVGPTAPTALDYYDYKLLGTSGVRGIEVYRIRMTPKSRLQPLFDGIITIADGTFAVMGVDVRPNETFTIPFIKDIDLRFQQQFSLYDEDFWLPTNIHITGSLTISILGASFPKIGLDQISSMYDYSVNMPIPDSIRHQPRLRVDSAATVFDSTFWKHHDVLPLTSDEQHAYTSLDSTQTLQKQFEPTGPLASLGLEKTASLIDFVTARFDRVEGFYLGGNANADSLIPNTSISIGAGIGFSDEVFKYRVGATLFSSDKRDFGIGGSVYRSFDHAPDGDIYGPLAISLMALIDKDDYRDYFFSTGWQTFATYRPSGNLHAMLTFTDEQEYSLTNQTDYSLFGQQSSFRANPPITDGALRSFSFNLRVGPKREFLDLIGRNALELLVEHSSPSIFWSGFDFTLYRSFFEWNLPTFSRSFLFPQMLHFRISAGTSQRSLPPQRLFTLDSRASGYAPFGVLYGANVKEFIGDRYVMINIEHNFRTVPFLFLNLPFLYRNNINLILHGSVAQTWIGSASSSSGWYYETGVGISHILDFLRMDVTYRFVEPKRFFFSVSIANLL